MVAKSRIQTSKQNLSLYCAPCLCAFVKPRNESLPILSMETAHTVLLFGCWIPAYAVLIIWTRGITCLGKHLFDKILEEVSFLITASFIAQEKRQFTFWDSRVQYVVHCSMHEQVLEHLWVQTESWDKTGRVGKGESCTLTLHLWNNYICM